MTNIHTRVTHLLARIIGIEEVFFRLHCLSCTLGTATEPEGEQGQQYIYHAVMWAPFLLTWANTSSRYFLIRPVQTDIKTDMDPGACGSKHAKHPASVHTT